MTRYFQWVLGHRLAVTAVVALLTLLSMASITRAIVATSIGGMFLGESPDYLLYLERSDLFGSDEVVIAGWDAPEVFQPEWNERLRSTLAEIEALDYVLSATSVLDVQRMSKDGVTLTVATAEGVLADGAARDALLAQLRDDPLAGGLLIAKGSDRVAVIVELTHDPDRSAETGPRLIEGIARPLRDAGLGTAPVHIAGHLALMSEILDESYRNILIIFPLCNIVLLLIVWLMFHRLWPAAMALGVSSLAVIWTLGVAVQMDRHVNILMSAIPAVVLIVGFSDAVHLISAYMLELTRGKTKNEAILESARDVGRACLWTSLTTLVGFLSLTLIPTPIFRQMGVVLGLGVFFALVLAMTMCPILFSWLREPKPLREGATSRVQAVIDRALDGMRELAMGRPRTIVAIFLALTALAVAGALQVRVETDMTERLEEDNPTVVANRWFGEHFAATRSIDLYIEAPEAGGLLEADVMRDIAALQDDLRALPGVDAVFSIADLFGELHRVQTGHDGLPDTRAGFAQYLLLFEMGGGEDLDRMIDFDRRAMRMTMRLEDLGYRSNNDLGLAAERLAAERLGDRAEADASGIAYLVGGWLDEIMSGQRNGLTLSFIVIGLMMMVALRSAPAGLLSMLPNTLPLLALAGYVGWAWDTVDSDTLIIGIIAIGIGVDDTIHFLVRFRVESEKTDDVDLAIRNTFHFAGRAIVMTTVILVAGFLPWLASNYFSTQLFGSLLPASLIVALLGDLLLVPAMAALGWIKF
ncbi:MAG: MMPL family transporter [Proteobacteria bacterium]|nr:MMPL family transporter [Pseudomonadota bacterium]